MIFLFCNFECCIIWLLFIGYIKIGAYIVGKVKSECGIP